MRRAQRVEAVPVRLLAIIRGKDIDPDVIDRAVHADSTWKDVLQDRTYAGERVYRWLDDGQVDPKRRSGARPKGESRRLAVDGHQLRGARTDKILEASIDAGHGKTKSLADDACARLLESSTAITSMPRTSAQIRLGSAWTRSADPWNRASGLHGGVRTEQRLRRCDRNSAGFGRKLCGLGRSWP